MAPIRVQTCLEPDHAIEILRGALSLAPWRTGKPERTQSGNVCRSGPLSRAVQTKLLIDTRKFEPLALNRVNLAALLPSAVLLRKCNPFGIPSTSRWTGAAIIEK